MPILQITIYEIRHFTLITELLTFPQTFHFFAGLFGGTLLYHRSPCPDIIWGNGVSPKKTIWGNGVPRVPPRLHH